MLTAQQSLELGLRYGVHLQPGIGRAWPELKANLDRLYADKIAPLPWVPRDWLAAVREIQTKYPDDVVLPVPASRPQNLGRLAEAPSWVVTPDQVAAWDIIWSTVQEAYVAYAKRLADEGAAKLAALYAQAAFWDGAYKLAKFARDLPAAAVRAVGGGLSDFAGTFLPDSLKAYAKWVLLLIVLLIGGGLLLWYKGKLGKLAAGFGLRKGAK